MILIRPEEQVHIPGVRRVEELAFARPAEAELVDRLRARGAVILSLVALEEGEVVGHVLFSPVKLLDEDGPDAGQTFNMAGLGPVAVDPAYQRQGIAAKLIRAGLEEIRQAGYAVVVVLGDPAYYSRFGFAPASRYGVRFSDPNVPAAAFQVLELRRGALEGHAGVAQYTEEFDAV